MTRMYGLLRHSCRAKCHFEEKTDSNNRCETFLVCDYCGSQQYHLQCPQVPSVTFESDVLTELVLARRSNKSVTLANAVALTNYSIERLFDETDLVTRFFVLAEKFRPKHKYPKVVAEEAFLRFCEWYEKLPKDTLHTYLCSLRDAWIVGNFSNIEPLYSPGVALVCDVILDFPDSKTGQHLTVLSDYIQD